MYYKEQMGLAPQEDPGHITGPAAEREVLGTQPVEGYEEYLHTEKFEQRLDAVAKELVAEGIVGRLKEYYPEQSDEQWEKTVREYARIVFLNTKDVKKRVEDDRENRRKGKPPSIEAAITEKMRGGAFSLNAAVKQMLDVSAANKKAGPEKYAEGISTPFTTSLVRNVKSMLKRRHPEAEFVVEYVPAILADPDHMSYLDAFDGVDAFLVVADPKSKFFRIEFMDFTINPQKTHQANDRPTQVLSAVMYGSEREEKKHIVYIEQDKVRDFDTQVQVGYDCADSMISDIEAAYALHAQAEKAA